MQANSESFLKNIIKIQKVGSGVQGTVYKAYHIEYDMIFALKELSDQPAKNFKPERERQIFEKIKESKNVIHLFEHFIDENKNQYFMYQFCPRSDLWKKIAPLAFVKQNKVKYQLSEYTIYRVFLQCLRGFKIIHKENIIHRDFKEQNIFIDAYGTIKIGDFGCSKIKNMSLEQQERKKLQQTPMMGNKFYRAPQIQHLITDEITTLSDIWGLGLLVLHMIAREQFLGGKSSQMQLKQYREMQYLIESRDEIFRGKWKEWKNLIKSMLKNRPFERSSAQQLLQKLQETKEQRQKWFSAKYRINFLIQDKIDTKSIIEMINPYTKQQREDNIRVPVYEPIKRGLQEKKEEEQVFLGLIKIREFIHFGIERLIQWYKIINYQNFIDIGSRKENNITIEYLCLKIFIFKIQELSKNMEIILKEVHTFNYFFGVLPNNKKYKEAYKELIRKQTEMMERKKVQVQKKVQNIQVKYKERLVIHYNMIVNTPKKSCESLLKKLYYDQNREKVKELVAQLQKKQRNTKTNIKNYRQIGDIDQYYYKEKKEKCEQEKEVMMKRLKGHIHLHLLLHLDQYLERASWENEEYIKVKVDNFQIFNWEQLEKLYQRYH